MLTMVSVSADEEATSTPAFTGTKTMSDSSCGHRRLFLLLTLSVT
jgi:hypothetical protein